MWGMEGVYTTSTLILKKLENKSSEHLLDEWITFVTKPNNITHYYMHLTKMCTSLKLLYLTIMAAWKFSKMLSIVSCTLYLSIC